MGSGLYSWVKTGEVKAEGNSITEGIGQATTVPGNLDVARGVIDDAVQVADPEALEQIFELQAQEGLSVGGSAGINVMAAILVARADGARPYGSYGSLRRRGALSKQAVQPGIPAGAEPAGAFLVGGIAKATTASGLERRRWNCSSSPAPSASATRRGPPGWRR